MGPWRNTKAPYLPEIMDRCRSRAVEEVIIVGPSQCGKTEVPLNVIGHAVKCQASDILMLLPTRELALDFAERRVQNKLLRPSPDLIAELFVDKLLQKTFRNGSMLTIGWPVVSQLSSRPVPIVILDEYDRMPEDIGGEGDARYLGRQRIKTYGRNGKLVVISSPSKESNDGIVGAWQEGDQNILAWPCPRCGEYFTPGFGKDRKPTLKHLHIPAGATPDQLVEHGASLICPECGGSIAEIEKEEMLASAVWLPRGMSIDSDGVLHGDQPGQRISSFWLSGLCSAFQSWGKIAATLVTAQAAFEKTGDEEGLKTVYNTELGIPFVGVSKGSPPPEIETLKERQESWLLKTVPAWVRYLTASVDVQIHHFAVSVWGWGEHNEAGLIDRYDIARTPDGAQIDPANAAAHWDLIYPHVIQAVYPLAGDKTQGLPIACTAIDSGGAAGVDEDGVTTSGVAEQAREFSRRMFFGAAKLPTWRLMLVKGASTRNWPMLPNTPKWETDDLGKRRHDAVAVYTIGGHLIKNSIDARLRFERAQDGETPRPAIRFPQNVPDGFFEELTAERKIKGAWVKQGKNESWDGLVYAEAARLRLRPERVADWSAPPVWASPVKMSAIPARAVIGQAIPKPKQRRVLHKGVEL